MLLTRGALMTNRLVGPEQSLAFNVCSSGENLLQGYVFFLLFFEEDAKSCKEWGGERWERLEEGVWCDGSRWS